MVEYSIFIISFRLVYPSSYFCCLIKMKILYQRNEDKAIRSTTTMSKETIWYGEKEECSYMTKI